MPLIDIQQPQINKSEQLAKGFLAEANQHFESTLASIYDSVERLWYRNKDVDGNPALEGDEPSGIEILQAMGPYAGIVLLAAQKRAEMAVQLSHALGKPELVDLRRLSAPYELTFKPTGELDQWTLRPQ